MSCKTEISDVGFMRLETILKLLPISKSTWYRGCKKGMFPKPLKLYERITVWRVEDVMELINKINKGEV